MKPHLLNSFCLLLFFLLLSPASVFSAQSDIENCFERPAAVKDKINELYSPISSKEDSCWGLNGEETDPIFLGMHSIAFAQSLIKKNPNVKDFSFLDLGSGKFAFPKHLYSCLEKENLDRKITIVGTRGEKLGITNIESESSNHLTLYQHGNFKIEDLKESLDQNNHGLFNVIWSEWTLRYLADPIGVMRQAWDRLKEGGYLFFDGFLFHYSSMKKENNLNTMNARMFELIKKSGAPFCMKHHDNMRSFNQWCIKKTKEAVNPFHMSYDHENSIVDTGERTTNVCRYSCQFQHKPDEEELETIKKKFLGLYPMSAEINPSNPFESLESF